MILCFALLVFTTTLGWVNSDICFHTDYMRFSTQHVYYQHPNIGCKVMEAGIGESYIELILREHNMYRSRVAIGNENLAGRLPSATNMLQMEWDDELAMLAQKKADTCDPQQDCENCRAVDNFAVGQNIFHFDCDNCTHRDVSIPRWKQTIEFFYKFVDKFDKKFVDSYRPQQKHHDISNFTQLIWAETWKVGCGYVMHKAGKGYRQLFVCNYGPKGNIELQPVYKQGNSCDSCPINSCCDATCEGLTNFYPGLCKMLNVAVRPYYRQESKQLFFNCDFSDQNSDCFMEANGVQRWKHVTSLQGTYETITLNGGESSTVLFIKTIIPKKPFCFKMVFRKGPTIDGACSDSSKLLLHIYRLKSQAPVFLHIAPVRLQSSASEFVSYSIDLGYKVDMKFKLEFSVPSGQHPHVFDIKEITATQGDCPS